MRNSTLVCSSSNGVLETSPNLKGPLASEVEKTVAGIRANKKANFQSCLQCIKVRLFGALSHPMQKSQKTHKLDFKILPVKLELSFRRSNIDPFGSGFSAALARMAIA